MVVTSLDFILRSVNGASMHHFSGLRRNDNIRSKLRGIEPSEINNMQISGKYGEKQYHCTLSLKMSYKTEYKDTLAIHASVTL
jgi:hypothetical protein